MSSFRLALPFTLSSTIAAGTLGWGFSSRRNKCNTAPQALATEGAAQKDFGRCTHPSAVPSLRENPGNIVGADGGGDSGLKLRHVAVVMRHGARTPVFILPGEGAAQFNDLWAPHMKSFHPMFFGYAERQKSLKHDAEGGPMSTLPWSV